MSSDHIDELISEWGEQLRGKPKPGFYAARLQPFCPRVAVRMWMEPALDDEGRKADRPDKLVCKVIGDWVAPTDIWSRCREITAEEYEALVESQPEDPWKASRKRHG
jgi:hypothetical protein